MIHLFPICCVYFFYQKIYSISTYYIIITISIIFLFIRTKFYIKNFSAPKNLCILKKLHILK